MLRSAMSTSFWPGRQFTQLLRDARLASCTSSAEPSITSLAESSMAAAADWSVVAAATPRAAWARLFSAWAEAYIIASQNFLQPGSKMVTSSKSSVPTVTDQAAAMQLGQCAKNLATCLAELRTATQKAHEACGPMEIDSAMTAIQNLQSELQDAKMAANAGQLKPLPGESLEKCAQDLGSTSKSVGSSMAQLLTCAAQGNEHY
ncbi:hypothetical protein CRUP_010339, partial [Coryphaenoides rupestris]